MGSERFLVARVNSSERKAFLENGAERPELSISSDVKYPTPAELPLAARPEERLDRPERVARGRFFKVLALCLLAHLCLLVGIILEQWGREPLETQDQEVSVEVVNEAEPPQAEEQPPPPAPEPPKPEPEPQKKQEPPPKQKLTLDEKPAFDAPRAENKEQFKREAPDERTQAQKQARPNEETAPQPEPKAKQKPQQLALPQPAQQEEATAPNDEEKREAEIIEQAAPKKGEKNDKKPIKPDIKAAPGEKQKSIAEMVASLTPIPDFKVGGAAKSSPISGGTAQPTYLSTVYGYILRKFSRRATSALTGGVISFYVDPNGNLIHQALRKSSGSPSLDQEALSALKRAGPFPPTPNGASVAIVWTY